MKDYIKELSLRDTTKVVIRPIGEDEFQSLDNFYSKIPRNDFLVYKDDNEKTVDSQKSLLVDTHKSVFQLGAINDGEIVAKGALYSEGLYLSEAAEIKLIVEPDFRHKGLGSQMFNLLLFEGLKLGYKKIIVRYSSENHHITKILNHYGFYRESLLNFYIDDQETNQKKDLIIASFDLENWRRRFEFYNVINRS